MISRAHRRLSPKRTWIVALLAAVAAAVAHTGAQAQETEQPDAATTPAPQMEPSEVSDDKLRQFVAAATDVQDIQQDYMERAQSLQEETQQKMVESVEDAGMTVEEFQSISQLLQTNPEMLERLEDLEE